MILPDSRDVGGWQPRAFSMIAEKSLVLPHFRSGKVRQAEIVEAVLDRMEDILFEVFPPTAAEPWGRLQEFFDHRIQVMVEHPDISRILLSDHLAHLGGDKPTPRVKELKRRSRQFVTQCLKEAADNGAMASDVSVNAATVMVLGAILAVGHASTQVANETETRQLTDELWRAIEKMRRSPAMGSHKQKGGHRR